MGAWTSEDDLYAGPAVAGGGAGEGDAVWDVWVSAAEGVGADAARCRFAAECGGIGGAPRATIPKFSIFTTDVAWVFRKSSFLPLAQVARRTILHRHVQE